jgi:hypothetical protein
MKLSVSWLITTFKPLLTYEQRLKQAEERQERESQEDDDPKTDLDKERNGHREPGSSDDEGL